MEVARATSELNTARNKTNLKKYKQTVLHLESKIHQSELLQCNMMTEIKQLRIVSQTIDSYKETIKKLEAELVACENVRTVLTSTVADVDELLKKNNTSTQLAIMVGSLKREMNANERKKLELRNALKSNQRDLQEALKENRDLKNKISSLESDLFNRKDGSKACSPRVQQQKERPKSVEPRLSIGSSMSVASSTPASPYLPIRSSAVGLTPLGLSKGKVCLRKRITGESTSSTYTILKKPRLVISKSNSDLGGNRVPNGLGGSEKNNVGISDCHMAIIPNFSMPMKSVGLSANERVKKGALKNINNIGKPI